MSLHQNRAGGSINLTGKQVELTNWSKSARSACYMIQAKDISDISGALAFARAQHLTVIPHGAGHSYTDAALNTGGVVIDLRPMRRILSWDPELGVITVEPGVTVRQMVEVGWKDGWWPAVLPSTPEVTIGGCAAMNINGRNSWKAGPFGASIRALDILLANGETCTLTPERDNLLFQAVVGSMGLLGLITSITIQLQRIHSRYVTVQEHPAASLDEIFNLLASEELRSDFMEAWLDGFATGERLGRGRLTRASYLDSGGLPPAPLPDRAFQEHLAAPLARLGANLGRPWLMPGVRMVNRAIHWQAGWESRRAGQRLGLVPYMFWPPAAFAGYDALFPEGVETIQAFVPELCAKELFREVLDYSQRQGFRPVWCVIKRHRRDSFLLSYQVDGFSLELNYQRTRQNAGNLQRTLESMIAAVIEAGGRFYLAKDHFLTHRQYRQSLGDEAVDGFLALKRGYDPEMRLQSDLFRRVLQPGG